MLRHWGVIVLLIAALCVVGCQKKAEEGTQEPAKQELTIFSWWTAGGEADGLNQLISMFETKYPNTKVVNAAVAGGAGTNAKAVLKTRMLGGDAPGTFQVHGGAELLQTWVKPGLMAPLNEMFASQGFDGKFPAALMDMVSLDGKIYAVPSNVHRGNALWYNKALFEKHGITPPVTLEDMFTVSQKLKDAGVTPLALASRNKWPVTHLFETLLLATYGPEGYNELFAGKRKFTDAEGKKALETLAKLLDYSNTDHAALTWDQACGLVQQGKAAMTIMGDWAKGYFLAQGMVPVKDYDAAPSPGTKGNFVVITDCFGMPAKAPNKQATLDFLAIVGSAEGQKDFNIKKGSIPARTDVPMDEFDPIAKATMADFKVDKLVPSLAHGSAAIEQFVTSVNDQLSVFIQEKNVQNTAEALDAAAKDAGLQQ